jgi:predicted ArsR family transcriptional regulator
MARPDLRANSPGERIMRILRRQGGLTTRQLADTLRLSVKATNGRLKLLRHRKMVRREPEGRTWRWYATATGRKVKG